LSGLTKTVLESALEVEMEHLGYAKHAPAGRDKGNSRKAAAAAKG
jgi:putative transposase